MTAFLLAALALHWIPQPSNTTAGLRGLSVVSPQIAWASGSKGTILRTTDGGEHWQLRKIPEADKLDFRDIVAFNATTAIAMSIGPADASRLYATSDGGETWKMLFTNPDKTGFFDALKFWDRQHGILLGDPVNGHFTIFRTNDGGLTWSKPPQPAALENEGAFAASGTCLTLLGSSEAWFGTGGPNGGRVFHTTNRGKTWTVATTPLSGTVAAAGIFSLLFTSSKHGYAVGGDYQHPAEPARTFAITNDGGKTWTAANSNGFRSAVQYIKSKQLTIAAGTTGSDIFPNNGQAWQHISDDNLNALAHNGDAIWAVGPKGLILKLSFDP